MGYFIPGEKKGIFKNIIHDTSLRCSVEWNQGEIVMGIDDLQQPV